jgi:hypothetical protein
MSDDEKPPALVPVVVGRTWPDLIANSSTGPKLDVACGTLVDWFLVKPIRAAERLSSLFKRVDKKLEAEPVEVKAIPERVGVPIIEAVALEDREEMIDLWADLFVGAAKGMPVDAYYIDLVKRLDPDSAKMLPLIGNAVRRAARRHPISRQDREQPRRSSLGGVLDSVERQHQHVTDEILAVFPDPRQADLAVARLLALGLVEREQLTRHPSLAPAGNYLLRLLGVKPDPDEPSAKSDAHTDP